MGKYDGWDRYFETLEGVEHTLSFSQLEELIGAKLPPFWGHSSIPEPLIFGLARHDLIDGYAQRLAGLHR